MDSLREYSKGTSSYIGNGAKRKKDAKQMRKERKKERKGRKER